MDRRDFLRFAGSTLCATAAADCSGFVKEVSASDSPFIQLDRLQARNQNRSTVVCQHGMVCASQPLAAMAGIDVLQAGGNCVDAAIAANAMLGVTEPASNGIGGDLFAIVWKESDHRLYGLNASGRSPYDWNLEAAFALGLNEIPRQSPLSWTVPGCVSGWSALSERFGKLPLSKCLEAGIEYAREGFPLSPLISLHFAFDPKQFPDLAKVYHPGGSPPRYGDVFRNPALARSYELIASGGADAFYRDEIAERIVQRAQKEGGTLSLRDLRDHRPTWVDPVSTNYRGWDVWELPPNGQGIAALQILNILETFDISALRQNHAEHLHLWIEAKKLAFEDRAQYYADPQLADVPIAWLISKDYARERAALINPNRAREQLRYGDPPLEGDTIYLTAADQDGNMISLIQSLYFGFGSGLCPEEVGFSIQNRGQCFSLDPAHRNRLEPHKRPFHTIIPAFLTREGRPVMSFGVMGGDFQPQGHTQVLIHMLDYQMSPQQAGEQPRVAHVGSSSPWGQKAADGGHLVLEAGFEERAVEQLVALGHRISPRQEAHGGYQAIWRLDDPLRYFGGSDPRKDGAALGY